MTGCTTSDAWEHRLLARAYEPLRSGCFLEPVAADREALERAYDRCESFTYLHSRTFYVASGLLPKAERRAVRALYAFCRVSDDLVDRVSDDEPWAGLEAWRRRALSSSPSPDDWVALAWTDTCAHYRIPVQYAEQLIEGVARDLRITRYATFDDLASYAYGVASTVGLMAMHIVGFAGEMVIPYAVKLGVALQLTNILRDVGEDWRNGRIYLPQEELAAFGLGEADIAAGLVTEGWCEFMQFQIERVRCLYAEALPGIVLLNRGGRFAIAAAAELYRGILDDIEAHGWDNLRRRAYLSGWEKARRLPGIWWRATTAAYRQTAV
jgi:phytoene synthase